jgi:Protein of unknown function (DUF1822)
MNSPTQQLTFTVPLSFEAHKIAQNCTRGVANSQKKKQVYLNTLAVYAVDHYLRCLGIETNWQASDSRNPLMAKFMDVADLDVKRVGKLECRPVLPEAEVCEIPPEVREGRVGYVAVQFNKALKQATILGFTRTASATIPLDRFQSLEEFLGYLQQIRQPEPINLRQWMEEAVASGWLALNELLSPQQQELAFQFRNQIVLSRGQRLDLGLELGGQAVALVVTLPLKAESEVDILVQVYPVDEAKMPPGLKLIVQAQSGESEEVISRATDNFIQKEFSAESGEQFSVTVAAGEAQLTYEFTI